MDERKDSTVSTSLAGNGPCDRPAEAGGQPIPPAAALHELRDTLNVIVTAAQLLDRSFTDLPTPVDRRTLTRKITAHCLALADQLETLLAPNPGPPRPKGSEPRKDRTPRTRT